MLFAGLPENVNAIANFQHFVRGRGIKTNDLVPLFDWLLNCSSTGAQGRGSQAGSRHHYGSPARLLLGNGVRVEQDVPLASFTTFVFACHRSSIGSLQARS